MSRWSTETGATIGHRELPDLGDGISVIVPSHRGRTYVAECLRSLAVQTLVPDLFEVVVVLNGEPDGSREIVARLQETQPRMNLRVIEIAEANASVARNAGIAAASCRYTTFVDDDDTVSPAYLERLLACTGPGVVPYAQIVNIDGAGGVEPANPINTQAISFAGRTVHPARVPRAVGFNACKLISTQLAASVRYDPGLRSSEDVVYFATLLVQYDFHFYVCPVESGPGARNAVYYRLVRPNSLSRQAPTFEFSVAARMEVISRLAGLIARCEDGRRKQVVWHCLTAQVSFINRYLDSHPSALERVLRTIESYQVADFPYYLLTRGLARSLVISYCFPPFADTSGVVAAKRVRERGEIVDVVYNAMGRVREVDASTAQLTRGMIDRDIRLATPSRFSHWPAVERFCHEGLAQLEDHKAAKAGYERVYSRVNWPASHFLAAVYKSRHPAAHWRAEFSDPVSHGIDGKERTMPIGDGPLLDELRAFFRARDLPVPATRNAFRWCEYLAFGLADEIVFTNENQLEYMLSYCEVPELARHVRTRAVVEPQPTLPRRFYSLVEAPHHLDRDVVNFGYFGAFYATRGIDDVVVALSGLRADTRARLRLHVFTNADAAETVRSRAEELAVAGSVVVRPYLPYLEFLNIATRFDWLIVNDAVTADTHPYNPYLPSKWSDYRASGTPVWGIVERGSPLSTQPLDHLSTAGEVGAAQEFLKAAVAERLATTLRVAPTRGREPGAVTGGEAVP